MRITEKQLRQIIKEELTRNLREEDSSAAQMELPPASSGNPYAARTAYRDYIRSTGSQSSNPTGREKKLRDAARLEAWNEAWEGLTDAEHRIYVALVKKDPAVANIAGDAILQKQYNDSRFGTIIKADYPEGAGLFTNVAGKDMLRGLESKINDFNFDNSDYALKTRLRDIRSWALEDSGNTVIGSFLAQFPMLVALVEKSTGQSLGYGDKPELTQGPLADLLFAAGKVSGRRTMEP